ncbi:MAG TPA: hypothetical protein VF952_04205 [Chloroflexia bacterium]|jgi:hypothetical protein
MNFDIQDIPTIEGAERLGRRPSTDSDVVEAYPDHPMRKGNILSLIGVPLGMQLVQRLQTATAARGGALGALGELANIGTLERAASASYTTYYDCAGYPPYGGTCNEACFGFAPDHMDPWFCATCAEQAADPVNNPSYNWHFTGLRGSIQYKDREPDVCNGKDAWKWKVGACGNCQQSAVFRCHDGYKKFDGNDYWEPTICQGLVSCDDQLTLCP